METEKVKYNEEKSNLLKEFEEKLKQEKENFIKE